MDELDLVGRVAVWLQISPTAWMPRFHNCWSASWMACCCFSGSIVLCCITCLTNPMSPVFSGITPSIWLSSRWQWLFIKPGVIQPFRISIFSPAAWAGNISTIVPVLSTSKTCPSSSRYLPLNIRWGWSFRMCKRGSLLAKVTRNSYVESGRMGNEMQFLRSFSGVL